MPHSTYPFGYCTNVHAGTSLSEAKENLLKFAEPVRQAVSPQASLPVGLWLAEDAASSLSENGQAKDFGDWLQESRFVPYTFNGFPQRDFHQRVVKHAVYEPNWQSASRVRYTTLLARILAEILPPGARGSISTLPLGWPHEPWGHEQFSCVAEHLLQVARSLDELAQAAHREIVLAIEPEPGCVLNNTQQVVDFFQQYLLQGKDAELARRYLTVCHDMCHSGVMFESQQEALKSYLDAGIRIGKVQVSSAVHVPWDKADGDAERKAAILAQLRTFNEPKYLHQTTRSDAVGALVDFSEDLEHALNDWCSDLSRLSTPWRVHFHVPIFVDAFGQLETTRSEIHQAVEVLEENRERPIGDSDWFTGHYEVETYAWPVLPESLASHDLASGIASELQFFAKLMEWNSTERGRG